jgi:hypothetical protein
MANISGCATPAGALVQEFPKLPPGSPFHSFGRNALKDSYVYFDRATPGAANVGAELSGIVAPPVPSNSGGFLGGATTVTLTSATPGATVRYTDTANASGPTDGSEPTETTGLAYSGGISVGSTRVIRAAAFAPGMIPSPVVSFTYLIGEPAPTAESSGRVHHRQPTALAVPPLRDHGDRQQRLGANYPAGPWSALGDNQQYNNANFRGIWGERPVTWQHIAANGAPLFNLAIGLRMAGSPYTRPRYVLDGTKRRDAEHDRLEHNRCGRQAVAELLHAR